MHDKLIIMSVNILSNLTRVLCVTVLKVGRPRSIQFVSVKSQQTSFSSFTTNIFAAGATNSRKNPEQFYSLLAGIPPHLFASQRNIATLASIPASLESGERGRCIELLELGQKNRSEPVSNALYRLSLKSLDAAHRREKSN